MATHALSCHDEQSKARESVAISLSPSVGGGSYNSAAAAAASPNGPTILKPSNWKTRICNKWEMTGYCPFGSKYHFAHGAAELHKYGGGLVDIDGRDIASTPDSKQAAASSKTSCGDSCCIHCGAPSCRRLPFRQPDTAFRLGQPKVRAATET
eukprot:UN04288